MQSAQQRFNKNTNRIYRVFGHPRAMKIRTFSPGPSHGRAVAGSRISGDLPNLGVSRKMPQIASECYQNIEKAPKNSTEFLHISQKHPKKTPKILLIFLKNCTELFRFFLKVPKKAPEKLPNSGEISIWRHLCCIYLTPT